MITSRRALICDANSLTSKLAKKMLSEAGIDCTILDNVGDTLRTVSREKPDLLILNAVNDGQSCFHLCRELRQQFNEWQLPIIVFAETDNINDVNNAIAAGATDFIAKPISWQLFSARVKMSLTMKSLYEEINQKQTRLRKAQAMARIGYWHMKNDPSNVVFSDEFCQLLDIPPGSVKTFQDIFELVHPQDQERFMNEIQKAFLDYRSFQFQHRIVMPNQQIFQVTQIGEFISDESDKEKEFFVTMRDDTERYFANEKFYFQKYFDELTGFYNKNRFKEALEEITATADVKEKLVCVLLLGVDNFKNYNDALGYAAGDAILVSIGNRLSGFSTEVTQLARYDADTFGVVIDDVPNVAYVDDLAQRILATVNRPVEIDEHRLHVKASIGIAFYPTDADNVDALLVAADTAMHAVKSNGGNDANFHTAEMHNQLRRRLSLETSLRDALDKQQLEVFYQPQISSDGTHITGMEALLRWKHPEKGFISPAEFIPVAEDCGLIVPIGEWVLRQALEQSAKWHRDGFKQLRIGINLSAKQFNDPKLFNKIETILTDTSMDKSRLELEVTESTAMSDINHAIKQLNQIRDLGIHASMDDFGTGHSSLSNLQLLPLDTLKIDRAFVKDIGLRKNAGAIAKAILAMAKGLEMNTIAEGVETDLQLQFMRDNDCDIIQGFYYSPPLAAAAFDSYLKNFDGGSHRLGKVAAS